MGGLCLNTPARNGDEYKIFGTLVAINLFSLIGLKSQTFSTKLTSSCPNKR